MMSLGPCLYCKQTVGSFSSVEHIFPESLGNQQLVLPKGTVCDRCNNGVLAWLDNVFLDFEPIAFMRTMLGIPNKAGKVPSASFTNMKMIRKGTDRVVIHLQGRGKGFKPNHQGFHLNFQGRRYMPERCRSLTRSFYKIGLALVHYDHGPSASISTQFDGVREIVLGKRKDFSGFLAFSQEVTPQIPCEARYQFIPTTEGIVTVFQVTLFGIPFLFDLERRKLDDPDYLRNHGFIVWTF